VSELLKNGGEEIRGQTHNRNPSPPLYYRNRSNKVHEDNTMIYKLKQKLRVNWKAVWELTFSTLLMAFLIALVTVDFFNLGG